MIGTGNGLEKIVKAEVITEERLIEKFKAFHRDTKSLEGIEKWGYSLPTAEVLVELFVADFTAEAGLIGTDYYTRYTPVGRILLVGTECPQYFKDTVQVGSYIVMEDGMVGQMLNPEWKAHKQATENPQYSNFNEVPPQFITRHLKMIDQGWYFHPDKTELCLDSKFISMWTSKGIGEFKGPYVFRRPFNMVTPVKRPFGIEV